MNDSIKKLTAILDSCLLSVSTTSWLVDSVFERSTLIHLASLNFSDHCPRSEIHGFSPVILWHMPESLHSILLMAEGARGITDINFKLKWQQRQTRHIGSPTRGKTTGQECGYAFFLSGIKKDWVYISSNERIIIQLLDDRHSRMGNVGRWVSLAEGSQESNFLKKSWYKYTM